MEFLRPTNGQLTQEFPARTCSAHFNRGDPSHALRFLPGNALPPQGSEGRAGPGGRPHARKGGGGEGEEGPEGGEGAAAVRAERHENGDGGELARLRDRHQDPRDLRQQPGGR